MSGPEHRTEPLEVAPQRLTNEQIIELTKDYNARTQESVWNPPSIYGHSVLGIHPDEFQD